MNNQTLQYRTINKTTLITALQEELPGREAHKKMMPFSHSLNASPSSDSVKQSAVLLLIYPTKDELHFCLTQRNSQLKYHPGQISLPGGQCEKFETNPKETALRETEEEIGVDRKQICILGQLSKLYIPVSNFNITPYLGWASKKPKFTINTNEVEQLISLPLHSIFENRYKTQQKVVLPSGEYEVPCYNIEGHIIWGATSMMISELEELLRKHYSHLAKH
jgi:8-oxo-dGTP pyrophosphatase MutT (NUDIX family)